MTAIKPEDILSDSASYKDGIRKGSVAAAIANAKQLLKTKPINWNSESGIMLKKLSKQALEPLGLYEVLVWKNQEINSQLGVS